MQKITFNDFVKSMTMFFTNKEIDEKYLELKDKRIEEIKERFSHIGTKEGLEQFIRTYPDSLNNLLTILGVSSENFKRVISSITEFFNSSFIIALPPYLITTVLPENFCIYGSASISIPAFFISSCITSTLYYK